MNHVQERVLNTVKSGGWNFSDLKPLFLNALLSQKQVIDGLHIPLMVYEDIALKTSSEITCFSEESFIAPEGFEKLSLMVKDIGQGDEFFAEEVSQIQKCLEIFRHQFPDQADLFQNVFSGFFRVRGGNFSGSSNPRAWGICFLGDRFFELPHEQRLISMVHEMAHQELFLINLLDRLANKEADSSLVYAPLQGRARPPVKRLHSLWALFRMLQFARKADFECAHIQSKFDQNSRSFLDNELTTFGKKLLQMVMICSNSQLPSYFQSAGAKW